MRRQFGRRQWGFRKTGQRPESVPAELRQSLQHLGDSITETVKLLERFEERSADAGEERPEAARMDGPLIPNRRSQLLAKIDRRPSFRRQN